MVRVCVGGGEVTVMHEIVFAGGGVIWSEVYFCYFISNINEFFKMRGGSGSLNLTPFSKSLHTMLLAPIIKSKAGNRRREGALFNLMLKLFINLKFTCKKFNPKLYIERHSCALLDGILSFMTSEKQSM